MSTQTKSFYQNTIIGVISGIIEVSFLQPLLYCKNASQQKLGYTINPRILYRGVTMSMTNMAVLTGLQVPLTDLISKSIFRRDKHILTGKVPARTRYKEKILSSFGGGVVSGLVCAPMELIMVQQQRHGYSLVKTPSMIISRTGVRGLMRGLIMSSGREGLFTVGYLGIGPIFSDYLKKTYQLKNNVAKIYGAIGVGIVTATLSHPMDTIKTCMQGDIERKKYTTIIETAKTLFKEKGISRFFYGWGWRTVKMIGAIFIMSQCKDRLSLLV